MNKLIIPLIILMVGCEKELHQDISNTFLEIYSDLEYDGDVYIFSYKIRKIFCFSKLFCGYF